jgi:Undecaprenyl-phosphate galactose phosphotransferase WbaP
LGANDLTARIIQAIGGQSLPSFVPVAVLTDDMTSDQDSLHGVPIISPTARAGEMARERGVEIAMIALPEASGEELVSIAQDMSQVFRRVLIVPDLYGLSTVQTDVRDLEGLLALEVRTNLLSPGSQLAKRVLELIITALATALFTPLILLIVLALALERQGPILFGHSRVGKGGKRFTAWKFRTMVKDADSILKQALARSPQLKLEWENKQKLKRDPRLTVVGRLLRRFSLDELPQLWNVLRQDMNLVGPRPIVEREVEKYGQAISLYYQVRPGMTGLWQVSGRSDLSYDERIQLDSYYVRNWSVWLDLVILLRTTLAVLGGRGAY